MIAAYEGASQLARGRGVTIGRGRDAGPLDGMAIDAAASGWPNGRDGGDVWDAGRGVRDRVVGPGFPQFYWNDADREPPPCSQLAAAAAAVSDALDAQAAAVISALWGAATRDRPPGVLGPTRSGCAFLDARLPFRSRRGVVAAIWWPHGEDDRLAPPTTIPCAAGGGARTAREAVASVDPCWGGCAERGDPPGQAAIDLGDAENADRVIPTHQAAEAGAWIVRGRELAPEWQSVCSGQAGGSALLPDPAWHWGIGRRGGGA